jgi:hypothetical protein
MVGRDDARKIAKYQGHQQHLRASFGAGSQEHREICRSTKSGTLRAMQHTVVTARRSPLQSTYILPTAARSGADSNPHISCPLPLTVVPTAHSTGLNSRVRVADHGCCSSQHAQDAKSTPHRGSVFSSSPATTPDVLSSTSGIDLGFNTLYKLAVACYDVCAQRGEARSATATRRPTQGQGL